DGDQRRRHDITRHAQRAEQPPERESARAGLVADRQPVRPAELLDEPTDRRLGRLDPRQLWLPARRRQHRSHDRELVHVERDEQTRISRRARDNVRHGWSSTSRMRLWPKWASTPLKLTREPATR